MGRRSRWLAPNPAMRQIKSPYLPTFAQTQDVGDDVAEIASLNDDVGHALMRSSKGCGKGCVGHSGYVGNVLESWCVEIG